MDYYINWGLCNLPSFKLTGTWDLKGPGPWTDIFPDWQVANEVAKPQVSINSNNSPTDSEKTTTGNGNLQPEIESSEYSSTSGSPICSKEG